MDITHILLLLLILVILSIINYRNTLVMEFKIGYYEANLKNRGVDIDYVKNITLWQIIKM